MKSEEKIKTQGTPTKSRNVVGKKIAKRAICYLLIITVITLTFSNCLFSVLMTINFTIANLTKRLFCLK
jgi:hypothetical protein